MHQPRTELCFAGFACTYIFSNKSHNLIYFVSKYGTDWHHLKLCSTETLIETGLLLTKESLATRRDFLMGVWMDSMGIHFHQVLETFQHRKSLKFHNNKFAKYVLVVLTCRCCACCDSFLLFLLLLTPVKR